MAETSDDVFTYVGGSVAPGETANIRYTVSETYLGDPLRLPVTIVNGDEPGPTACLTAATHGDELNGIEVVRTVAQEWNFDELAGTIICLPVVNVPGFLAQHRYLPILDRDLNRSFPGDPTGTSAKRIAATVFDNFIEPADLLLDFHTSTRGRNNILHVRADIDDDATDRLARSFASPLIIASSGPKGSLRREATETGVPAITVELGEAHRFQRDLIDRALDGVQSVFAEYGLLPRQTVRWPGWRTVVDDDYQKTWIRADAGGIVDMRYDRGALVYEGDIICQISNPFKADPVTVPAPFTGVLVGVLENPVVYPGNPLVHLVELSDRTTRVLDDIQSE